MQDIPYLVHLGFGDDTPPLLLGELTEDQINYFYQALKARTEGRALPAYSPPTLAIANPAKAPARLDKKKALTYFNGPQLAMARALLPNTITYGPYVGQPITYPITKKQIESVDLLEACVFVATFVPSLAKKLPSKLYQAIIDADGRGLTRSEILEILSGDSQETIDLIKTTVSSYLLRENTKLAKRKVPSSLGFGVPTEDPRFNLAPIGGGKGLGFLPHDSLINTGYGARSYLEILQSITPQEFNDLDAEIRSIIMFTVRKSIEVLRAVKTVSSKPTCCPYASDACKSVCLVDAGQRYATRKTLTGTEITDTTKLDAASGRVSLASLHTAFIANPIAFFRVFVESCLQESIAHETEIFTEMLRERSRGERITIRSVDTYKKKMPCSIRLNVYSDYVWENICPDLFKIFNGKTRFGSEGVYPFIQFYDYTKISGRWNAKQKAKGYELLGIDASSDPNPTYSRPDNYHLTFSYNGSEASKLQGEFGRLLGQNITYVFYSTYLTNALFSKFVDALDPQTTIEKTSLTRFVRLIRDSLAQTLGESVPIGSTLTDLSIDEALPEAYLGIPVINGDAYDLRYLDQYANTSEEGFIVGLSWKGPTNLTIRYKGTAYQINPLSAALALSFAEKLKSPNPPPDVKDRNIPDLYQKLYSSAAFGIVRLFLGEFQIEKDGKTIPISLFISPSGNPSAKTTLDLLSKISSRGTLGRASELPTPPSITFSTEQGSSFSLTDSAMSDLQAFLTKTIGCSIDIV